MPPPAPEPVRRPAAIPDLFDESLGVGALDKLADDRPRLGEAREAVEVDALLLGVRMNRSMTPLHSCSPA